MAHLHSSTIIMILIVTVMEISPTIVKIQEPQQGAINGCEITKPKIRCFCHRTNQVVWIGAHLILRNTMDFEISNCDHVIFTSNTVSNKTNLRKITLRNINNLIFEPTSIHREISNIRKRLAVTIINSKIDTIPSFAFKGISQLMLVNVTIGTVSPYAFYSTTKVYSIRLFKTRINQIESLAFQKLSTQYFIMNGCTFKSVSTNAFSNIYIQQNFFLTYSNVSNIKSDAFNVYYSKRLNVTNAFFYDVEKLPFRIRTAGASFERVNFYNTKGEIFAGLQSLSKEIDKVPNLTLRSLVFDCFSERTLEINTNHFHADVEDVSFIRPLEMC